ncbi:hypothetical protein MNB_SUP05-SYMBIONT-5-1023 [hydrothermal vent metagenome]|uniref:DUF4760 domain-containing protein n=1 Tax=hydrothermal vent metagenome TaxID=652676 RepID=A0A1W1E1K4_9ZZZZ
MSISSIYDFLNSQASTSIAGFLIIIISVVAIYMQRKTAKQKATIEYLRILSTDDRLKKAGKILRIYYNDNEKNIAIIASSDKKDIKEIKLEVVFLLNYFESLAIGVKVGIYDFNTVRLSRKQQIIHTSKYSQSYFTEIRKKSGNPLLFENLEWLSNKLSSET